ncbi:MAG: Uma2 family endonuclease [Roseiflexus sp.]
MSIAKHANTQSDTNGAPTTAIETPVLRLIWTQSGAELDLGSIQGLWTDEMYLRLTDQTKVLIELTDGVLEILPMPTRTHQRILALLYRLFVEFVQPRGGEVLFAAFRLRIRPGKYREPDLLLLLDRRDPRNQEAYWSGADLVLEIVSPDNPERDLTVKRRDYAEASIREYWIVNPLDATITVLTLDGAQYVEHGVFPRNTQATSRLLEGFAVPVSAVFDIMR